MEPAGLPAYFMQVRPNVAYHGGTGVVDLGRLRGTAASTVDLRRDLPDFHIYLTLDEYLIPTNRDVVGWSLSSSELE